MNLNQIIDILDTDGFDQALQSLCQVTGYDREIRLYAVWCAQQVQHLLADQRSINALNVSAQFATGFATAEELASAHVAAEAAADAASDAAAKATKWVVKWNAAQEVDLAAASCAAACASAALDVRAVACFAIGAAAGSASAIPADQFDAADASREAQEKRLREICATQDSR